MQGRRAIEPAHSVAGAYGCLSNARAASGARHMDAVYVLHCFHKTTPKTARADIDLAGKRYKLIGT